MHKVGLVLEQLVDALDDIPLAEHDFVPHVHELVLHVRLKSVYEMYAAVEKRLEEFFLDVSPVRKHFPVKLPCEHVPHTLVPVIHVSPCETERYDVAAVVAHEVQLEAVAPAHGPLAVLGQAVENLVEIPPDVVANGNHRAVNECYPRAFAEGVQLHEQHHFDKRSRHELYETVVGHGIGELTPQAALDKAQVILLETAVGAEMVTDEDGHYLALRQPAFAVPASFAVLAGGGQAEVFSHFRC